MPEKLEVGILGAGWAGSGHAVAFSRLPDVEIAALWSRTRTRAETLAGQLNQAGMKVYDDWRDLIDQAEVDVISLATPPALRSEPLLMALARGCHVLVEKPLTVGLTDADTMLNAARQSDMITAAVFNWRYAPGNQAAKRAIEAGQIGKVLDIHSEWRVVGLPGTFFEQKPWVASFEIGDGPLSEGLGHDFDRIRFLTGCEFKQVVSRLATRPVPLAPEIEIEGNTSIILADLSQNILSDIRISATAGLPEWRQVISSEAATLQVTHQAACQQALNETGATALEIPVADQVPEGVELLQHCWNRLIADFVTAIRSGDKAHTTVPNLPSLDDGLKVQQIVSAARLSDQERRWVALNELA